MHTIGTVPIVQIFAARSKRRFVSKRKRSSEDDDHIFSLTPYNVTSVRLAIGTDQQDKLIRNIGARRDFDRGTKRRHISDCAADLRICKDDLTGLKPPNRRSAFMHVRRPKFCCRSSELLRQRRSRYFDRLLSLIGQVIRERRRRGHNVRFQI
jgi:hypothetical protein